MRVALDSQDAAFYLMFEFTNTAHELMVELALVDELMRLSGKDAFG